MGWEHLNCMTNPLHLNHPEQARQILGVPQKRKVLSRTFGSDEESEGLQKQVVVDAAIISSIAENLAEEREKFEEGKKIALLEELRQEVEDYSDVSDREIEESREVRMKDLSV